MQVHEMPADLRQKRRTHGAPVDPGSGSARRGDLTLEHDQRLVGVDAALVQQLSDL